MFNVKKKKPNGIYLMAKLTFILSLYALVIKFNLHYHVTMRSAQMALQQSIIYVQHYLEVLIISFISKCETLITVLERAHF